MSTHGTSEAGALPATSPSSSLPREFLESLGVELRTSLNSMLGFAQLSLRDSREPLPERHKLRIAHVVAGGEHLLRVLDDAVLLSRIESGSLALSVEPSDLAELIRAAIATLEPMAAAAGVSLERFVPPEPAPPVALDRKRVLQILIKYGTNAIKYNLQGGSVSFAFTRAVDRVRIAVVDTGPGISEGSRGRLFEPFARGGLQGAAADGTGLGLVIAKRLAAHMGGRVGYRDIPSGGSEFWVELPLQASSSRSGVRPAVTAPSDEAGSLETLAPATRDRTSR